MRLGIRGQLLFASLSLLVIPWLGYQYVLNLEGYLRISHEEKLLDRVSIMAAVMHEQEQLLDLRASTATTHEKQPHFYVRPLHSPIQLDGYTDDWGIYHEREHPLGKSNSSLSVKQRMGHYQGFLYLLLKVKDDSVVYRQPESLRLDRSDHLRISMLDSQGKFKRYQLTTIAPGWVSAYEMPQRSYDKRPLKPEFQIKGEWQETDTGYTIELRIPLDMIGAKFAIAVADVDSNDDDKRKIINIAASANTEVATQLGTIAVPSEEMESLLQRITPALNRLWIVDPTFRVIGMSGSLQMNSDDYMAQENHESQSLSSQLIKLFYRFVLQQPLNDFTDKLSAASRLDNPAIASALAGTPKTHWRTTGNEDINVVIAAHPIYIKNEIAGVIAIEENSNSILIMQNRVIEAMMNLSIIAFVLIIGVLLAFTTRLSFRIRKLRNEVDNSIADDGKIKQSQLLSHGRDEVGDLGRSFSSMLQRLTQYNRYLETMAGKLSHELRTPVAIVRSSLENLEQENLDEKSITYVKRAQEGTQRLNNLLTRMTEATNLEQTILHEEKEHYNASRVIKSCIESYQLSHQENIFSLSINDNALSAIINGSPELLAQLLDKLIDNAMDFALPNTPIHVSLKIQDKQLMMNVSNQGVHLPKEMQDSLFDSMVSVRQHKTKQPHLGLGLYIVHLISEFHKASITARNIDEPDGVIFSLQLPIVD